MHDITPRLAPSQRELPIKPMLRTLCWSIGALHMAVSVMASSATTGPALLDSSDLAGSFKRHVEKVAQAASEIIAEINAMPGIYNGIKRSLVPLVADQFAPQPFHLSGALRNPQAVKDLNALKGAFHVEEGQFFSKYPSFRTAKSIIESWHSPSEIGLEEVKLLDGRISKVDHPNSFHVDDHSPGDFYSVGARAILTLPAVEYPLEAGVRWLTTDGEEVFLHKVDFDSGTALVHPPGSKMGGALIQNVSTTIFKMPKCVSQGTTMLTPFQDNVSTWNNFALDTHDVKESSNPHWDVIDRINSICAYTEQNAAALLPVSFVAHSLGAVGGVDIALGCEQNEIQRKLLLIDYSINHNPICKDNDATITMIVAAATFCAFIFSYLSYYLTKRIYSLAKTHLQ